MITLEEKTKGAVQPRGEPVAKPFNGKLRDSIEKTISFLGLTQKQVATEIGVSDSELNKWLKKTPAGNVEKTERLLSDWQANKFRQENAPNVPETFIHTKVTDQVNEALNTIRETCDFGLIIGPAGCQKTRSNKEYALRNPSAVRLEITDDNASRAGIARLLLRQIAIRQSTREALKGEGIDYVPGFELVRHELKDSGRLIMFDCEISEPSDSGLRAMFDLHNTAGVPVAVFGNESLIEDIRGKKKNVQRNERRASRVGFKLELKPFDADGNFTFYTGKQLEAFIELHVKSYSAQFFKLCRSIAQQPGYLRSLHKHLLLFMRARHGYDDDAQCLRDANDLLLTQAVLED